MTNLNNWSDDQKVVGKYCRVPYAGKLVCSGNYKTRPTPDYRATIFVISLDSPIEVFGTSRDRIEVWSNDDSNSVMGANS